MKHRSPLFTLAAVAVAFAIMFIVNMVAGRRATAPASRDDHCRQPGTGPSRL